MSLQALILKIYEDLKKKELNTRLMLRSRCSHKNYLHVSLIYIYDRSILSRFLNLMFENG